LNWEKQLVVMIGAHFLACLGVFALSANTMTGKNACSHPAQTACVGHDLEIGV
jgi:hypothetical protein